MKEEVEDSTIRIFLIRLRDEGILWDKIENKDQKIQYLKGFGRIEQADDRIVTQADRIYEELLKEEAKKAKNRSERNR